MKEEYKKNIEQIHAPKELVTRIKARVKLEENEVNNKMNKDATRKYENIHKNVLFHRLEILVAAAIFIMVIAGGAGYYQWNHKIIMNEISSVQESSVDVGMSLGQHDQSQSSTNKNEQEGILSKEKIHIIKMDKKDEIVETLLQLPSSEIEGRTIYLGKSKETGYFYACVIKGRIYYKIVGTEVDKKEFIKYIKENINSL